jgi:hypothetical protein
MRDPDSFSFIAATRTSIGFVAFFLSHYNSSRVVPLNKYLHDGFSLSKRQFEYYFVDYSPTNTTTIPNLTVTEPYRQMARLSRFRHNFQRDLLAKYFFVFSYVSSETHARWIYRGADDSFINFNLLPGYLDHMNRNFDPESDFVIRGHCVRRSRIFYHQGGSGILYSRRAVTMLSALGEETLRGQTMWEDAQLGWKLGDIGINVSRDTCSIVYLGTPFPGLAGEVLVSGEWASLPQCNLSDGTILYSLPLSNVVFVHQAGHFTFEQRLAHAHRVFTAPRDVYLAPCTYLGPSICHGNVTEDKYSWIGEKKCDFVWKR